jgi:hypothetical protein
MHFRVLLFLLLTCAAFARAENISYQRDIQPIFTAKCVACHACYDAPCQLKLGSAPGTQRGASKAPVYNGARTEPIQPSRLFLDAQDEQGWRSKGFYSVLDARGGQAALLAGMLELGRGHPLEPNAKLPKDVTLGIERRNICPMPGEFAEYAKDNPHGGMPYAVTGLSDKEFALLRQWLDHGAPVDWQPVRPSSVEVGQIADWERLLNAPGARENLVARWLYEHLYLAHLHFEGGEPGHFFELVRSSTPSGEPIEPIATRRPNDDPGLRFFYRLRPIQEVIVRKSHTAYALSAKKMARVRELFFAGDWQVTAVPSYGALDKANPFKTFQAIPVRARYQFMLDNAEFFVKTFIRGPVCRGQIATDVLRDRFWTLFQAPDRDLYITDAAYREKVTPLLELPGQFDNLTDLWERWAAHRDMRNQYSRIRTAAYAGRPAQWADIWSGNDNALLTVFRQHDSASVHKGLIGATPISLWMLDYPLLESTYYELVVNFDVFGNISHQAQTRLYFDLIRNAAERNFLRLLPSASRQAILDNWYQDSGKLKLWLTYTDIDTVTPSGLGLPRQEAKERFGEQLLRRHVAIDASPDPINRCTDAHCYRPGIAQELKYAELAFSRLSGRPEAGLPAIHFLPEASLLRVEYGKGKREVYSLMRDRALSNVAFMLGEEMRYIPGLDKLTLYPGVLSSYPNFLFNIEEGEVPAFVEAIERVRTQKDFDRLVERWGIRRTHPKFWRYFNDVSAYLYETEPLDAGVLDLNRYENL